MTVRHGKHTRPGDYVMASVARTGGEPGKHDVHGIVVNTDELYAYILCMNPYDGCMTIAQFTKQHVSVVSAKRLTVDVR